MGLTTSGSPTASQLVTLGGEATVHGGVSQWFISAHGGPLRCALQS